MGGRTQGDRIDDLERRAAEAEKVAAVHMIRLDNLEEGMRKSNKAEEETGQRLEVHQRESEREIALLKREVEELKQARKELSDRFWKITIPLVVAVLAALIISAIGLKK